MKKITAKIKKLFILCICICLSVSLVSCGSGKSPSDMVYEQSFDDADKEWKPSLLSRAGLEYLEEPAGNKTFTEGENGNFTFTITPADPEVLSGFASGIYSRVSNLSDKIQPSVYSEALDSETHFKVTYDLAKETVCVEMSLAENVLNVSVTFE